MATPSIFQPTKTAVEAVKDWLGDRDWLRATNGNPAFSEAATYLWCLQQDAKAIDDLRVGDGPVCALPELLELAKVAADARRGLDGWETAQGIKAIEAAAEGRTTIQAQERRERRED